jgi:hypothetical protein
MTGLELMGVVATEVPGDGLTPVSMAIAIIVARDRWTTDDDQKYRSEFKDVIFKWAGDIGEIPRLKIQYDENEVCQRCKRLVREHSLDQFKECGLRGDDFFRRGGFVVSDKKYKHLAPILNLTCGCGRRMREHTIEEMIVCIRKDNI